MSLPASTRKIHWIFYAEEACLTLLQANSCSSIGYGLTLFSSKLNKALTKGGVPGVQALLNIPLEVDL